MCSSDLILHAHSLCVAPCHQLQTARSLFERRPCVLPVCFQEVEEQEVSRQPLVFCHFALGAGETRYAAVRDWAVLRRLLSEALDGYNELNAAMDLVLFEEAMQHV